MGKSVVLHLLKGPELRKHFWEDREEKKAQHPVGFEPTTSLLRGMHSTAEVQPLPGKQSQLMWSLRSIYLSNNLLTNIHFYQIGFDSLALTDTTSHTDKTWVAQLGKAHFSFFAKSPLGLQTLVWISWALGRKVRPQTSQGSRDFLLKSSKAWNMKFPEKCHQGRQISYEPGITVIWLW